MKNLDTPKVEALSIKNRNHGGNAREILQVLLLWKSNMMQREVPFKTNKGANGQEMSTHFFRVPWYVKISNQGHG